MDTDNRSDVIAVKDYFEMTTKEARMEIMQLAADERRQLGEGIRNGTLNY